MEEAGACRAHVRHFGMSPFMNGAKANGHGAQRGPRGRSLCVWAQDLASASVIVLDDDWRGSKRAREGEEVLPAEDVKRARLAPQITRIYYCVTKDGDVEGYVFTTRDAVRSKVVHALLTDIMGHDRDGVVALLLDAFADGDDEAFFDAGVKAHIASSLKAHLVQKDWSSFDGDFEERAVTSMTRYRCPVPV